MSQSSSTSPFLLEAHMKSCINGTTVVTCRACAGNPPRGMDTTYTLVSSASPAPPVLPTVELLDPSLAPALLARAKGMIRLLPLGDLAPGAEKLVVLSLVGILSLPEILPRILLNG
ncbi:hypothetical protein CIHG_04950 [Coccidioides immitis H538.4]|uniref:Uncharacterized protein n=3 Tax=Coccidioides immitis TaxID=5501 RepID=A0A0J8R712_COCIT|nr:hypothetical protein CIRG_05459 [Coccidioides immitis RMSCC 2394]KMU80819.1 hypothetical protein CISG_08944 [Coccidioides immitis RMSCC 3703]KMU87010.1 hypothetical protein CIHG_04950 [Coccidioides immitis H538.4]